MSRLLTARDMNDDEGPKNPTYWTLVGKGNKIIIFRPSKSVIMSLAGAYN